MVCDSPERPEQHEGRAVDQRRLDEGLRGQRRGPEIKRGAGEAPAGDERERRDEPVDVAQLQRQSAAPVDAAPVPPDVIGEPDDDRERGEAVAQYARLFAFGIFLQARGPTDSAPRSARGRPAA